MHSQMIDTQCQHDHEGARRRLCRERHLSVLLLRRSRHTAVVQMLISMCGRYLCLAVTATRLSRDARYATLHTAPHLECVVTFRPVLCRSGVLRQASRVLNCDLQYLQVLDPLCAFVASTCWLWLCCKVQKLSAAINSTTTLVSSTPTHDETSTSALQARPILFPEEKRSRFFEACSSLLSFHIIGSTSRPHMRVGDWTD